MDGHARRLVLALGLLVLAAAVWIAMRPDPSAASPPALEGDLFVDELEPAPLDRARLPDVPAPDAGIEELWLYGERFLGWTPRDQVELETYDPEDLREWIRQDRSFYLWGDHGDWGSYGYVDDLGYE